MPPGRNGQSPDKTEHRTDKTTDIAAAYQRSGNGAE
jgi:hypothetical protein